MTTKDALAEASSRAWNADQRLSLRGAFTALDNLFKDVLLLRGKRVTAEVRLNAASEFTLPCPFKPKAFVFLNIENTDPFYFVGSFTGVYLRSVWDGRGEVTFTDVDGVLPPNLTVDVFMERG